MATASVTATSGQRSGTGTLTYTVSSTNTATTFSATKAVISTDLTGGQMWRAYIDGDYIYASMMNETVTLTKTKSWNRSTSAQTKQLVLEWVYNINGETRVLATKTVNISVPALASYTVSYNANGGSGTTSSQTKYYGKSLTLRSNGFTKTNYAFKCWNTSTSDPSASRYAAGATYTGNAALALYAIWNPKIVYNANGGTGAPATQTKTFGSTLNLQSSTPTRTGYTFSKWNSAANGSGTNYNPSQQLAANDNTAKTLYAQWAANTYTISFNANNGTGAPSSISKTYGQSVTLPTAKPTRIGHTFLGWALSSSAVTAQWLAGANFSEAITANTTLYAVWRDDYESPNITTLRAYRCGFEHTTDAAIDPDKTYYERSGSGTSEDPYIYTEVEEPDVSEISTYYGLIDDDEAGYARVEATWSIDTSVDEGVVNSGTLTGTITPEGQPAQTITFQSGYQGTSGNAVALIDDLDVDTQYTVTVTVTDTKGASAATSRTVLLLRAFYIFDFGSQGNAVGIGRAAPQNGMEVGYPATFDDTVNLYDELQFNGEQTYPTFIRSSWDMSSDQTTLPVTPCFVLDTNSRITYWCDGVDIRPINVSAYRSDEIPASRDLDDQQNGETWFANQLVNAPNGSTGYWHVVRLANMQLAVSYSTAPAHYWREYANGRWSDWAGAWNAMASRTANTVLAAPNGSAGAATFRSLVAADIPSLAASKITSGILGVARGGTGISNSGHYVGDAAGSNISLTATTWTSTGNTVSIPASTSGIIIGRVVFTGNSSNAGTFRQLISTSTPASDTSADASTLPYDLTPFWSGSGGHYFTSWVVSVINNTGTAASTRTQYVYSNQAVTVRNYQLYWIPIGHSF